MLKCNGSQDNAVPPPRVVHKKRYWKDRLKMQDMKRRYQNAGVETARNGNWGTILKGLKVRHTPLWTAKRTLSTILLDFSLVLC